MRKSNKLTIDFIIPAYNSKNTITSCLTAILDLMTDGLEINIKVIDNNSQDLTAKKSNDLGCEVLLCKNQGRSQSRNFGAYSGDSEYIAFVDSDVILDKNWLLKLMPLFSSPCVGAARGPVTPGDEKTTFLGRYRKHKKQALSAGTFIEMEWSGVSRPLIDSAAFIVRRSAFNQINGFDESLSRQEDIDFSYRLVENGYSLRTSSEALCIKKDDRTIVQYLFREFSQNYHFISYLASMSPQSTYQFMKDVFFLKQSKNIKNKFFLFDLLMDGTSKLGIVYALLKRSRSRANTKRLWHPAKLNHLLPCILHQGKLYRLCSTKRFALTDQSLIFYGFIERSSFRFQEKNEIDFFRNYVNDKATLLPDFMEQLISKKIFIAVEHE